MKYDATHSMFERQVTCLVPGRSMETYHGQVRSPADAIILFEACRIGLLPRVQRRLSEKERASITSGSVFVWDEREAGMRRWTDGKSWSSSRVSGSFLTYREMEGRRSNTTPVSAAAGGKKEKADDAPEGYRYKPDGLMKQSFSISTSSGQHLHLISYYSRSAAHGLPTPTQDPRLRQIRPEKGMYPESQLGPEHNSGPAIVQGPMGSPVYSAAAHASPMLQTDPSSPYRRPGYPAYNAPPPYNGPPPQGYIPPSPLHTPAQSPYPGVAHSPLHQVHFPARPPRGNAPLTAFDRPPAPLSNNAVPPHVAPSPTGPYYSASNHPQSHGGYPPPPERQGEPRQLPSLNMPPIDRRPDSVLRVSEEKETGPASGPGPSPTRSVIPSLSSLLNGVPSPERGTRTSSALPPDVSAGKTGLLNPDTRALRDLDKLTFRV